MQLPAPRTTAPAPVLALTLALLLGACSGAVTDVQVAPPPSDGAAAAAPAVVTRAGLADGDSSETEPARATTPPTDPDPEDVVVQVDGATVQPASALCRRDDGTVGLALGVDTEVVVDDAAEAVMAVVGPDGTTTALRTETFAKLGAVTWIGTFEPSALGLGEVVVSTGEAPPAC